MTTEGLDLDRVWKVEWTRYICGLSHGDIKLLTHNESVPWLHNTENGEVSANLAYDLITSTYYEK